MSYSVLYMVLMKRCSKHQSDKVFSEAKYGDTTLAEAKSNLPSSKTSSWAAWEAFVAARVLQPTLDVWKRKCFRKTAFWCYGKNDKCYIIKITGGVRGTLPSVWLSVELHPAFSIYR